MLCDDIRDIIEAAGVLIGQLVSALIQLYHEYREAQAAQQAETGNTQQPEADPRGWLLIANLNRSSWWELIYLGLSLWLAREGFFPNSRWL
jgi:hypothetical protein